MFVIVTAVKVQNVMGDKTKGYRQTGVIDVSTIVALGRVCRSSMICV